MATTYSSQRGAKVSVRRAKPIVRKSPGGTVHPDAEQGKSLIKRTLKKKKPALLMTGGAVRARLDRRSRGNKVCDHDPKGDGDQNALEQEATREKRDEHNMVERARGGQVTQRSGKYYSELAPSHHERGGRAKKGHTTVNVMVVPQHAGAQPMPVPISTAGPPPAAAMPPRPPVPPQGAPMMVPPPMMAPGTPPPIRQSGGRVMRASGGRIKAKDGPGWTESLKNMTPVQHSPGKSDLANIGRGKAITYKRGGAV
jgi:hypothetical protein